MATKTISIEIDVYDRLKALKRTPSESFSEVLRRVLPSGRPLTASELLGKARRAEGLFQLTEGEAEEILAVRERTRAYDAE